MHTNKKLFISLTVLLVLIALTWWAGRPSGNTVVGRDLLLINDTSSVARIQITAVAPGNEQIMLEESGGGWVVNNTYRTDPSVMRSLMGRLLLSRVKQKVGASRMEQVREWLKQGKRVRVLLENGDEVEFLVAGNPSKTESYFSMAGEEAIYQVAVPGYSMYIAGIFELTENQWRNRLLFSSDWRTIQSLEIDYTDSERDDILVFFDRSTLRVRGNEPTDTASLDTYIANFESFYTNEYISPGQIPLYDSLMQTEPVATISIQDIDASKNTVLEVYPKPEATPYTLLKDDKGNYSVVEAGRIQKLLPRRQDLVVE